MRRSDNPWLLAAVALATGGRPMDPLLHATAAEIGGVHPERNGSFRSVHCEQDRGTLVMRVHQTSESHGTIHQHDRFDPVHAPHVSECHRRSHAARHGVAVTKRLSSGACPSRPCTPRNRALLALPDDRSAPATKKCVNERYLGRGVCSAFFWHGVAWLRAASARHGSDFIGEVGR